MIITFIGHRKLSNIGNLFEDIKKTILININRNEQIEFYCGGYGDFDNLCMTVCNSLKKEKIKCEIIFITPYISESQQRKIKELISADLYDSALYPPLENVPMKFAISKRNEWIVNKADLIIAYVTHKFGGAYKTLMYAKRKKKKIVNLAEMHFK